MTRYRRLALLTGLGVAAAAAPIAFSQLPYSLPFANAPQEATAGRVTLDGDRLSLEFVLGQLRKSGVNFVIETGQVSKDKTLSVHIVNQPRDLALEAVAEALGLELGKKGDVFVLRNSFSRFRSVGPDGDAFPLDLRGLERLELDLGKSLDGAQRLKELAPRLKDFSKLKDLAQGERLKLESGPKFAIEWESLLESITPEQWDLHKKQGHLNLGDLNATQKTALRELADGGTFTITYADGNRSLTIKGD